MSCTDNPLFIKFKTYLAMVSPSLPDAVVASIQNFLAKHEKDMAAGGFVDLIAKHLQEDTENFENNLFALGYISAHYVQSPDHALDYIIDLMNSDDERLAEKILYTSDLYQGKWGAKNNIAETCVDDILSIPHSGSAALARRIAESIDLPLDDEPMRIKHLSTLQALLEKLRTTSILSPEEAIHLAANKIMALPDAMDGEKKAMLLKVFKTQDFATRPVAVAWMLCKQPPFQSLQWIKKSTVMLDSLLGSIYPGGVAFRTQIVKALDSVNFIDPDISYAWMRLTTSDFSKHPLPFWQQVQQALGKQLGIVGDEVLDMNSPKAQSERLFVYLLAARARIGDATAENELLEYAAKAMQRKNGENARWAVRYILHKAPENETHPFDPATAKKLISYTHNINDQTPPMWDI